MDVPFADFSAWSSARSTQKMTAALSPEEEHALLSALRATGMPADIAAVDPRVQAHLKEQGIRKIGQRHRMLSLLRQLPMTPALSLGTNVGCPSTIPRRLFTFWHNDTPPELVKCCIALMRKRNPEWSVTILHPGISGLPLPPVASTDELSGALQADWYRLAALSEYGGVYLDASCVVLLPIESWVCLSSGAVQGFQLVHDGQTMESWAIAAPAGCPFLTEWRDEFAGALRMGLNERGLLGPYCKALMECLPGLISSGLRPSLPYLAIHAAWCAVRARMPDAPIRLLPTVERGGPYRHLAEHRWESKPAVAALFAKDAAALAATPLIKLRGAEREVVGALGTYGRTSWLARELLGATTPTTMAERMTFLRCGLELD